MCCIDSTLGIQVVIIYLGYQLLISKFHLTWNFLLGIADVIVFVKNGTFITAALNLYELEVKASFTQQN